MPSRYAPEKRVPLRDVFVSGGNRDAHTLLEARRKQAAYQLDLQDYLPIVPQPHLTCSRDSCLHICFNLYAHSHLEVACIHVQEGVTAVTCSSDGTVGIWEIPTQIGPCQQAVSVSFLRSAHPRPLPQPPLHRHSMEDMPLPLPGGAARGRPPPAPAALTCVAASPDGSQLATGASFHLQFAAERLLMSLRLNMY